MPSSKSSEMHSARTVTCVSEIDPEAWDACAGTTNPFVRHSFLKTLEDSGSVGENTGWTPMHVVLETENGEIIGCAPTYVKSHSQGEYVFDHGWAEAFVRAGGSYYPKLQVAVPL